MLIFHIGLPKTATTFLQYKLFARSLQENFFHWKSEPHVKEVMRFAQGRFSRADNRALAITAWLRHLRVDRTSLVSSENISLLPSFWSGRGASPREVAERLLFLTEAAGVGSHRMKIIMGVRRQDQMLASRYSQLASARPECTQEGFEKSIAFILDKAAETAAFRWLYFDICKREIEEVVGAENLCIYPAERLASDPESVVSKLGDFCETDFLPSLKEAIAEGKLRKVNRKSVAPDQWKLGQSKERLSLGPELKAAILDHFHESNVRFRSLTGLSF